MKLKKINEEHYFVENNDGVITHSTDINFNEVYYIPLSEVKELLGEVDVEKRAREFILYNEQKREWWKQGYTQALEDNKERKYTIEDVINIVDNVSQNWFRCYSHNDKKEHLSKITKHLQKTEWEVEFINGKLTLK